MKCLCPKRTLTAGTLQRTFADGGFDMKLRRLAEEEAQEGTERSLTSYGVPLSQFTSSKYLGRVLAAGDDD